MRSHTGVVVSPLGRKGAALAALGDMEFAFFDDEPLALMTDGVKLGESTFSRFLLARMWPRHQLQSDFDSGVSVGQIATQHASRAPNLSF